MSENETKTIFNEDGEPVNLPPQNLPATLTDATQILPYNQTDIIAMLPERMTWDKKAGKFVSETIETATLEFKVVGAMFLWAMWSEVVGQPLDIQFGNQPPDGNYEAGIRLMIEVEDLGYYYLDCYGMAFKFAQGAVKRAETNGGMVKTTGAKAIPTKNGVFMLPVIDKGAA
jgi:hypothetical protein